MPLRRGALRKIGDHVEVVRDAPESLGPFVTAAGQRIEEELEARAVVMPDRLPHHLAHHVVAQIGRQVADPQPPGSSRLRRRQRLAVDVLRRGVVGPREPEEEIGLDVEEEQKVEELFEAIGKLELVARPEVLVRQSGKVSIELREVAPALAGFERLHGKRQRVRATRLEPAEVREPRLVPAGGEEHFAQVLVRGDMPGIRSERGFVRGDCRIVGALPLKYDTQVEMSGAQVRRKRERVLVRTHRFRQSPLHLQRDAAVVVRFGVGRSKRQRPAECRGRRCSIAARKMGVTQRAPQRDACRYASEAVLAQRGGGRQIVRLACRACRCDSGIDIRGRGGDGRREIAPRHRRIPVVAGDDSRKVMSGCKARLQREHAGVRLARGRSLAALVRPDRVLPRRGELRRGHRAVSR